MIHSVAHIEFTAINLALDAVVRFPDLPDDYYRDWLQVAADEARHFLLLSDRLAALGFAYGDFDAHDGLWRAARETSENVLDRMALVPRVLEARGLDASPRLCEQFRSIGDKLTADVLDVIYHDEIGHVAIGNRWYQWACSRQGKDAFATYRVFATHKGVPSTGSAINVEGRRQAGFSEAELEWLQQQKADRPSEGSKGPSNRNG